MPHPTPEDIIRFVLRALDTKDTTRIARHLTSCNECLDLVGPRPFEEAWNDIESAEESLFNGLIQATMDNDPEVKKRAEDLIREIFSERSLASKLAYLIRR